MVALSCAFAGALVACEGSEVRRLLDKDAVPDVDQDTETDVGPIEPALDFWFLGRGGDIGRGEAAVTLAAGDEPEAYLAFPGFQIDIDVEAAGVAASEDVRLFVDGTLATVGNVSVTEGVGTVRFSSVSIPDTGSPVVVRVETTDLEGADLVAEKTVGFEANDCELLVELRLGDNGCVEVGAFGATVFVTRESGACDSASGTAVVGGETVELAAKDFDEAGELFFELVVPEGLEEGVIEVEVEAFEGETLRGQETATGRFDAVAPGVELVTPAEGTSITLNDDADNDPSNGLQFEAVAEVVLEVGESVTLSLVVGDAPAVEVTATEGGAVTFPAVTLTENGLVTFRVTATDGCENAANVEREVLVLADDAQVVITAPVADAVLLAAADGDVGTTTLYETVFEVLSTAVEVGTTVTVECRLVGTVGPDDGWVVVGSELVAAGEVSPDGTYQVAVVVDVADGAAKECRAMVDVPTAVVSEVVLVTFGIPAGTIEVTSPVADVCITTPVVTFAGTAIQSEGEVVTLSGTGPDGSLEAVAVATVAADPDAGQWTGTYAPTADGAYSFEVSSVDNFGNPIAAAPVAVTVDRLPPGFSVVTPGPVLNASDVVDEDAAAAGYQTTVVVTVVEDTSPDAGEVCLTVNGASFACVPMAAEVSFAGVTLVTGANTLNVTGRDGCGNAAPSLTRVVSLTYDNELTIVSPAAATTLLARDDGNAATPLVYEMTFVVEALEAASNATFVVECRSAPDQGFVPVGNRTIAAVAVDGRYDVPVALNTATLGTSIECRALVNLPSSSASDVIALTVGLPAPSALIASPVAGTCVNDDFAVSGSATGLDGRTIAANLVDGAGATLATAQTSVAAGAWSTFIELGSVVDGNHNLTVAATDAFGNALSDGTPPVVAISVDRTAPVLSFVSPLGAVDEAEDVDLVAPGVQVAVEVQIQDAGATGGEVCLTLDGAALGCTTATSATVIFPAVTLQPGPNLLEASGTDGCDNASATVQNDVLLLGESPIVTIVIPANDLVTTQATVDFQVSVADPENGAPLNGLDVTLYRDGSPVAVTAVDNNDGTYTFAAVPLVAGTTASYVAIAVDFAAIGNSNTRFVTQKAVAPSISVLSPGDGTVLNLASGFCGSPGPDCLGTVILQTANAEDGSAVTLEVTCGAATQSYTGTVADDQAEIDVTLTNNTTCIIVPTVVDLASQTVIGPGASVVIDRTRPVVTVVAPSGALLTSNDADPGTDGIQAALRANVGGVPAGALVTAVLTWNGGAETRQLTTAVAAAVPDGSSVSVGFEDVAGTGLVTWPEGVVVVTVSVSDSAGNVGSGTRSVSVLGEATVRITGPTTAVADVCGSFCAAGAVCNVGTCWLAWGVNSSRSFIAVAAGLETTSNNIRVCSDDPALDVPGAVECDTAPSGSGPFRQVAVSSAINGINVLDVSTTLDNGYHRIVVEVQPLAGGGWVSSAAATTVSERERRIFVDLDPPVVASVSSPSDVLAPEGTLNAAEQKSTPRVFEIRYETLEAGRAELHVNAAVVDTRNVNVGATTLDVTLPEGNPQVWVVVTDAAGNRSAASPGLGATTYQPVVDVTAPTVAFTRPNASPLRSGDNLDVVLASDAEGRTVTLFDAGVEVGTTVVTSGVATFAHGVFGVLSDGSHTLTATVSDAAGNPSSAATTPATVEVDTALPLGVIIEPSGTTQFLDTDDSAPATPGFQVAVRYSTTNGAISWSLWTAKGCNVLFQNCQAPVQRASGAVTNAGGEEPLVNVDLDLDSVLTQQKIILQTVDEVGNVHTAEVGVQILVVSCALSFRNVPANGWYNASACGGPSSCATVDLTLQVGFVRSCGANRIVLYDQGVEVATINNPGLNVTFPFTIFDGVPLSLESKAFNGAAELGSTGIVGVGVDLVPPVVDFVAATVGGFTTPAEGDDVLWTAEDDADINASGMQFNAAVQVLDTNVDGGAITVLTATGSGAPVALTPSNGNIPFTLSGTSPLTQSLFDLTLPDGELQTVLVTVRDEAGNTDSSSFTATADASRPDTVEITSATVDPRRPLVSLTWTAVGDDGANNLPAGYEVRYSTFELTEDNWGTACDSSAIYGSDVIPAPAAVGQSMSASFGAPDTRPFTDPCKFELIFADGQAASTPTIYMGIRAIDEVGNLSTLGSQSLRIVTRGEIENRISRVRFSNVNNAFGATNISLLSRRGSVIGDINDDGRADWAAYSANAQALCVFLGLDNQPADVVVDTLSGPNHTCLLGTQMGALFVGSTQTGHFVRPMGDVNGDGVEDFSVAGKVTNGAANAASEAYVMVYFGRAGQLPDLLAPNIRIRGIRSLTAGNEYIGVCSPGDFDGVAVGGALTDDIAFGEPFASRVHVIPGRGTWNSATNLQLNLAPTFPTPSGTALVDNGAMTIETTGVWGITGSAPGGSPPVFGLRCGSAGDLLPTPAGLGTGAKGDLFVYQSGSLDARVFVFPGREFTAGTVVQVTECVAAGCVESPANVVTAEDQRSVRLRQDNDKLCTGFGGGLQGGVDLTGDGVEDLMVTHPSRSPDFPTAAVCSLPDGKSIFVFDGARLATQLGNDVRVGSTAVAFEQGWVGTNGWVLRSSVNGQPFAARAIGDFDGWGAGDPAAPTIDIAIGNRLGNRVSVRLNHERPGLSISEGQFPVVDGELASPYSAADNSLGEWVDGGVDLTGDGLPDFLTGARTGEILIIH